MAWSEITRRRSHIVRKVEEVKREAGNGYKSSNAFRLVYDKLPTTSLEVAFRFRWESAGRNLKGMKPYVLTNQSITLEAKKPKEVQHYVECSAWFPQAKVHRPGIQLCQYETFAISRLNNWEIWFIPICVSDLDITFWIQNLQYIGGSCAVLSIPFHANVDLQFLQGVRKQNKTKTLCLRGVSAVASWAGRSSDPNTKEAHLGRWAVGWRWCWLCTPPPQRYLSKTIKQLEKRKITHLQNK